MPVQTVINKAPVPVKIWAPAKDIESVALDQLTHTAFLPFVFKHVAAMPDVHFGMGATVGSVVATEGALCPCAVGVDIGCVMISVKTDLDPQLILDNLPRIRKGIEARIPVGTDSNKNLSQTAAAYPWARIANLSQMDKELLQRAQHQLGTLGGGNHFIEICLDEEGRVWIMLHSGSRNLGKRVAERHIASAKNLMKKMLVTLPDPDLAYLVEGTPEFEAYWNDLQAVQDYAFENRREMMRRVMAELKAINGSKAFQILMEVNCHHNYAAREYHYGKNVIVTRKGAVRARQGDFGIIPGSMGTRSYIVRGLGNPESFHSCSHGAGRRMSRNKAKASFTVADLKTATAGVECRKDEGVLDEIPFAYKNIDEVMEHQRDLVEVVAVLKQVLCVKG